VAGAAILHRLNLRSALRCFSTRQQAAPSIPSIEFARGTMDEVSSHVRLDLPFRLTARPLDRFAPPHPRIIMEGPWCRFRREARARERHRHSIRCVRDSFNIESTRRRRRTPAMTDVGDIAAHISAAAPDRKLAGNRRGSGRSLWARRVSNGGWLLSSLPG
jgi:hypothetical protein